MTMEEKPEILATRTVCRSRLFRIEQVDLRFSNGVQVQYERLRGSPRGAVLVVPMLDADTVLLVREYAVGVERYELGLPKGRVDGEETILETANRELMEEVGYGARRLRLLRTLTVAPGYLGHSIHVVVAEDLYPCRVPGDEPEQIQVVPWQLGRLDELLAREDFTEARSIAALLLAHTR